MKKNLFILAIVFTALCALTVSCKKDDDDKKPVSQNPFVGTYDLYMVFDSIMTDDGTWFDEEFYEQYTGKRNPPESGWLTVEELTPGLFQVTATFYKEETMEEKDFFTTTAVEKDGILLLNECSSDYFGEWGDIDFVFRNYSVMRDADNNVTEMTFKSVYTISFGSSDFAYLTSYTCTKRP